MPSSQTKQARSSEVPIPNRPKQARSSEAPIPNRPETVIRLVEYWINWLSAGFASGKWDSVYLGRGFDFQGIAPFPDDPDMVRLNWQASLISGELSVNQFAEERDIHLYLLANLGPSMAFGSEIRKLDRLAVLAAVLSLSAFRLKDRFRFVGYTNELEYGFPEPHDKTYPLQLAKAITEFDWRSKKRGGLVKAAGSIPSRRSLVIVISDFLGSQSGLERALRILAPNHEVLPLVLWDEREVTLPGKGFALYPLSDLETGELSYVFLTSKTRKKFEENSRLRRQSLNALFARFGIKPHFLISGGNDDIETLMKIFLLQHDRV